MCLYLVSQFKVTFPFNLIELNKFIDVIFGIIIISLNHHNDSFII